MVGVRVLVGSQSIDRASTYLEVFGRTTQVTILNYYNSDGWCESVSG